MLYLLGKYPHYRIVCLDKVSVAPASTQKRMVGSASAGADG